MLENSGILKLDPERFQGPYKVIFDRIGRDLQLLGNLLMRKSIGAAELEDQLLLPWQIIDYRIREFFQVIGIYFFF